MLREHLRHVLAAAILLSPGCSASRDDQPGAVTSDEASQLNDAAAMLDANSVDADALGNEETR